MTALARIRGEEGAGAFVVAGGQPASMVTMEQHAATALGNRQCADSLAASLDAFRASHVASAAATKKDLGDLFEEANRTADAIQACGTGLQEARVLAVDALAAASESPGWNVMLMKMIAESELKHAALEERVRRAFMLSGAPETAPGEGASASALAESAAADAADPDGFLDSNTGADDETNIAKRLRMIANEPVIDDG